MYKTRPSYLQCATLITAKQLSTCRTMLGFAILRHRLMTCDQPPLIHISIAIQTKYYDISISIAHHYIREHKNGQVPTSNTFPHELFDALYM